MGQKSSRSQLYYSNAVKLLDNAIIADDDEALNSFLAEGVFTPSDLDEYDLLHHAAMLGHVACMSEILARGASVHATDCQYGMTPLHCAAMAEDNSAICVFQLLRNGANPDHMGEERCGKTAFHVAIEHNSLGAIRALIQGGFQVNTVSECEKGISPILLAAQQDTHLPFKAILEAGADLRKCWMWKSAFMAPLDLITHRMFSSKDNSSCCRSIFKLLLQGDGNLYMTLCMMPQGQQTKVGAVRTLSALRTVVQRLDTHYRKQAQEFLVFLIMNGYRPRGGSAAFLEEYDIVIYGFMKRYVKNVQPLKLLCVRVIRKNLQKNVLYGIEGLAKIKHMAPVLDLIRMSDLTSLNLKNC
ncbi:hypothetical protein CAPTEDRAFT_200089 [Capitella teleta]|uniref:Uncharacterized protein n=1 Tax=Capitella teleta TaxID=283909 RepID=R7USD0_CAPTE|nr:hypothetical protein CAPTEDRAFT_200089 [Capitella teleta]|eukprot:ELU09085.1 hypothetical protein CAPTEDRAFT_200089 [Capitella teleta]